MCDDANVSHSHTTPSSISRHKIDRKEMFPRRSMMIILQESREAGLLLPGGGSNARSQTIFGYPRLKTFHSYCSIVCVREGNGT